MFYSNWLDPTIAFFLVVVLVSFPEFYMFIRFWQQGNIDKKSLINFSILYVICIVIAYVVFRVLILNKPLPEMVEIVANKVALFLEKIGLLN